MKSFNQFIQENWVMNVKTLASKTNGFPIYENPSSSDLVALKKSGLVADAVRFIAVLSTKKIYVWSGMEFIHSKAIRELKQAGIVPKSIDILNLNDALCGEAELNSGRLSFENNTRKGFLF